MCEVHHIVPITYFFLQNTLSAMREAVVIIAAPAIDLALLKKVF